MGFIKTRDTRAGSAAFSRAARKQKQQADRSDRRSVAGLFEYLRLGEIPIWVRLPPQEYTYLKWDKDEKKVIEVTAPFLEFPTHYYPKKRRTLNCSASAYRNKPCYPCAIEHSYWQGFREKERELREMGMDVKIEKSPPMRRGMRVGMACTGTDLYYEVPLLDSEGKPRKNANGDVIKKYVAEPAASNAYAGAPATDGHNMHWSFSPAHLDQLEGFNSRLENFCMNCAAALYTEQLVCADCTHVEQDFGGAIDGEDLFQLREEVIGCSRCHGKNVVPLLACPQCNEPAEGGIMCFDLRLKAVPRGGDQRGTDLQLVGHRLPNYSEELLNKYENPLDIEKIFAPWPLSLQKSILGDDLTANVDPSFGAFTEGYQENTDNGSEDTDDIPF